MKRGFLCHHPMFSLTDICSTSERLSGEKTGSKNQQVSRDYRQQQYYKRRILTVVNSKKVFLHTFSLGPRPSLPLTSAHSSLWRYMIPGIYLFLENKATHRNHGLLFDP